MVKIVKGTKGQIYIEWQRANIPNGYLLTMLC